MSCENAFFLPEIPAWSISLINEKIINGTRRWTAAEWVAAALLDKLQNHHERKTLAQIAADLGRQWSQKAVRAGIALLKKMGVIEVVDTAHPWDRARCYRRLVECPVECQPPSEPEQKPEPAQPAQQAQQAQQAKSAELQIAGPLAAYATGLKKLLGDLPINVAQAICDEVAGIARANKVKTNIPTLAKALAEKARVGLFVPAFAVDEEQRRKRSQAQIKAIRDIAPTDQLAARTHISSIKEILRGGKP